MQTDHFRSVGSARSASRPFRGICWPPRRKGTPASTLAGRDPAITYRGAVMTSASSTCGRRLGRVMNASTVADLLLIVAAVVWVLARQVQVARVKPRLLVLAPLVLAFFGIRSLPASTWRVPADLTLLAVSAALSLGLGAWRGLTIKVWRDADGTWWRKGSVLTLVLWGVLIAARGLP